MGETNRIVSVTEGLQHRFAYYLFGLRLASYWEFPTHCPVSPGGLPADLEIVEASDSLFIGARDEAGIKPTKGTWFQGAPLRDGAIYLIWPALFEFLVAADGRRIFCRQLGSSWESFQSYLLAQVLSFALLKQGIESFHATVMLMEKGAVGLIAPCGQGKSTLAAAFLKEGYPLLTDDLLVLKEEDHGFLAFSSFPRIKLFPRVARGLLGKQITGAPMNPHTRKLVIPLGPSLSHCHPAPLKAIFVLRGRPARSRSKGISIKTLSRRRAFLELMANSFNTVIKEPERIRRQFDLVARLTAAIPIKSLSYPRSLARLPEVVQAVRENLKKIATL